MLRLIRTGLCVASACFMLGAAVPEAIAQQATPQAESRQDRIKALMEAQAQQVASPAKGPVGDASVGSLGIRMVEATLLVLGLFFVGLWVYQKKTGKTFNTSGTRRIKVLERTTVGPKTALVLAEVDGRTVLMSVGTERVEFFSDSAFLEGAWDKERSETAAS